MTTPLAESSPVAAVVDSRDDTDPKTDIDSGQSAAKRLKTDDNNGEPSSTANTGKDGVTQSALTAGADLKEGFKREKLRKWALLLSYCGHGYYGMQRQTKDAEFPTVEYRLFDALRKSGVINEEKFSTQHLCRFQRAARTDRGVSAIKQIVSLLLPVDFADHLDAVNGHLPDDIRLVDCLRVTKFFDAKNYCDGRTYSYLMPTYALCPIEANTCAAYRLAPDVRERFNETLRAYLGTHNYHNFTSGKAPTDPSAMRYIVSMECSEPFLMSAVEFVVVRVKGQSFMLHQIRKMIGLAIAVVRGIAGGETIVRAFGTTRIDIPKAPGLGLLLEEVHYDKYNDKYGGDGVHEPIVWEAKKAAIDEFKHKHIYPVIADTERQEMPMFEWLQTLVFHTYDEREQKANERLSEGVDVSERGALWRAHSNVLRVNQGNDGSCDEKAGGEETNGAAKGDDIPVVCN
ncbi:unnamed protein product [Oppiella nova]|uniref:Pseudouridylate synthase 1 homolog n=1 Tax=Oppiella nova TaxID=334625 RepID=A0A7R9QNG8_9ACAR|nr:unnamed protein product [Oppiella nova]CAG2169113.1 unnamed protein product [Oppiella nova]